MPHICGLNDLKLRFVLTVFYWVFFTGVALAQGPDAVFFDQIGVKTSSANAYYYRELKKGTVDFYESRFLNGNLAFEGKLAKADPTDERLNLYVGNCIWYYKNGNKRVVKTFDEKSIETGKTTYYFETGKIWKIQEWEKGRLKNRTFSEFDEKGLHRIVFEEDFSDNRNDWDLYASDKSAAEIVNHQLHLVSKSKEGTSRFIRVPNESDEYSIEANFSLGSKNLPEGKFGLIFGYKDWQNYQYFLIQGQNIYIGEIFEGVSSTKANGFFSSVLYNKPKQIVLKLLCGKEKSIYSLNGDVQFTSTKVRLHGTGMGATLGGRGEVFMSNLIFKEFNTERGGAQTGQPATETDDFTSSGSGILLSKDGYVATNHHVVDKGKKYEVVLVKNGAPFRYNAVRVNEDKDNDLALLKIDDPAFKPLDKIEYALKTSASVQVGASVFSIGYPLQNILGQEPKFVDGKVSSKTGYQNSISTFQTSVPLQPGNSGSPLFNDKGELVGIMNAIVTNTDNVSYAIKLNFLLNLIDLLPVSPEMPSSPFPPNTSIEDMVKVLSSYTTLIKVK